MSIARWSERPLASCGLLLTGGTPSRSEPSFWDGRVPWISAKSLKKFDVIDSDERLSGEGANASTVVPPGSVLFVVRGMSLAKEFRVGVSGTAVAFNQDLRAIVPSEEIDGRFLARFLEASSPAILHLVDEASHGTKRLTSDRFENINVPVPPLLEQRRIAQILDKADALRATRRDALARLDTLTQAIFLDMFGDPLTNPKGFPIRTLVDFYVNQEEGTKCGPFGTALKKGELVSDGVPVWNMDNIDPSGRMALPFRMWITERKYRELESYAVADGDVIVSRAGTVGKMCVVSAGGVASIISTNLIRLRFGPDLLPLYFVSLMTYCKGRVGRLKTGADGVFTHMNTGVLDTLRFPYPPLKLQRRFVEIVGSIEKQRFAQSTHLAGLESLFTALQHHVFLN